MPTFEKERFHLDCQQNGFGSYGLFVSYSGIQIAIVEGGIRHCGDVDYPGLYIRLADPSIWNFVTSTLSKIITEENKEEKDLQQIPNSAIAVAGRETCLLLQKMLVE